MNIGIVTTWFERGAAYVSRAYMQSLAHEHNVFIFARGGEKTGQGDPVWDAQNVTWAKRNPYEPVSTYVDPTAFTHWVNQNNIDIVIFNEQQRWEIILYVRARMNIRIGAYVDYYTEKTVPFFRLYDFLLCNTKRHYDVFSDHPQCFYIPWGTDTDLFRPVPRDGDNEIVFFHSSGISPDRKGTDLLVDAFQEVEGDARLIIHSQTPMSETPALSAAIRKDDRIQVIEKEVGAPGLYHLGDVYVYPTRLEGIGLSVPEALSCGLPVVITDAPPMNEFIVDGLNGKLVKVENEFKREDNYYWPMSVCSKRSLSDAMNHYVRNKADIVEYRRAAREYAEQKLDWKRNSSELPDIFNKLKSMENSIPAGLYERALKFESARIEYTTLEPLRRLAHKFGVASILRRILRSGSRDFDFSKLVQWYNRIPRAK